jgi:hypothetical protein
MKLRIGLLKQEICHMKGKDEHIFKHLKLKNITRLRIKSLQVEQVKILAGGRVVSVLYNV